jgi:hypothetical protein
VVIGNARLYRAFENHTESDENSTSEEENNMAFNAKAAREEIPTEMGRTKGTSKDSSKL